MVNPFKLRTLATTLLVTIGLVGAFYFGIIRNLPHYPYGRSHCCDKALYIALVQYAEDHDGWFPCGEATPEASLSLLYRQDPNLVGVLPGKTIPESVVRAQLEGGNLLTPETCGWYYVEGLRVDDHPRLALFWDKAGLGHNGERLARGGHYVCFRSGIEYIPGARWQAFLTEQEELSTAIKGRTDESVAQEKADKADTLAKAATEQFIKAMNTEKIEAVMEIVETPFYLNGMKNVRDREELREAFVKTFAEQDLTQLEYTIKEIHALADGLEKFSEKHQELLKEILEKDDRIVFVAVKKESVALMIRIRYGKPRVAGFRD